MGDGGSWGDDGADGGGWGGGVLHARTAAAAGLLAVAGHLWMLGHYPHGWPVAVVMLAAAVVCIPCSLAMGRRCGVAPARRLAAMAVLMVVAHAALLLAMAGPASDHHHGLPGGPGLDPGMAEAMLGLIVLEAGTGLLAATWLHRERRAGSRLRSTTETAVG